MGTYSIDSIMKYINFYEIIKKGNAKYLFAIFNTDKENQPGILWWIFMDISSKNNLFLFDSFGILKDFNFLLRIMTKTLLKNYFIILKNVKVNQIKN